MRIECPACNAAYDVPDARLAPGRQTRCARCSTLWAPVPAPAAPVAPVPAPAPTQALPHAPGPAEQPAPASPPDEPPSPHAPAAEPEPEPPLDAPRPTRPARATLAAAWLLSIALLAALAWAAVDRRTAIMAAWPPSIRAYAALGLTAR